MQAACLQIHLFKKEKRKPHSLGSLTFLQRAPQLSGGPAPMLCPPESPQGASLGVAAAGDG